MTLELERQLSLGAGDSLCSGSSSRYRILGTRSSVSIGEEARRGYVSAFYFRLRPAKRPRGQWTRHREERKPGSILPEKRTALAEAGLSLCQDDA